MLDIVAATNDEDVLGRNLLRSPVLALPGVGLHLQRGCKSAAAAYNAGLRAARHDVVVFAHQDVYLPSGWSERLLEQIERVERLQPRWAVLGIYGIGTDGRHVGQVWSSGLNAVFGSKFEQPAPVQSVDELLIVLRRSSGIRFDDALPGFHVYGTDIVQQALAGGHGAFVVCAPAIHNSRPSRYLGADYFEAYRHVAAKWRDRLPIESCAAPLLPAGPRYLRLRLRHRLSEWRHAGVDRRTLDRNYDSAAIARRLGFE
ncbi:glycosyltransferase [Rivibacter subsaxonicus]|uniref:Glycosyl transferase family 2 n=1 Tax=Rivibacter subsaxonicus TaxID=457575 RepID=A0A4Q7VVT1_9BURK|nr:glycosyltransferase [Rivibacter subsaxonicus]RZU00787.1 glycosyl transferase family 2 [Rivibacter subsaxonicus]